MVRHLLLFCSLLVGLSGAAWSDTVDPFIGLDDPTCPEGAICVGTQFSSNATTGGGVFFFENRTGATITALGFQAEVTSFNSDSFNCRSVFFLNCSFTPTTLENNDVLLKIDFFGVNPPPPTELPEGCDSEAGEFEGIPVFNADCKNQGVIAITLNDLVDGQFNLDPSGSGGWKGFAPDGQSVHFTTTLVATPEPSTTILLGTGLALIVGTRRRWRRLRRANRALCCTPLQNVAQVPGPSRNPQPE